MCIIKFFGVGVKSGVKLVSQVASNKFRIRQEKTKKARKLNVYKPFSIAGVGFEPHDLRVMSPTSYQAALLRDMNLLHRMVPVTGVEPVRYFRITGF